MLLMIDEAAELTAVAGENKRYASTGGRHA